MLSQLYKELGIGSCCWPALYGDLGQASGCDSACMLVSACAILCDIIRCSRAASLEVVAKPGCTTEHSARRFGELMQATLHAAASP